MDADEGIVVSCALVVHPQTPAGAVFAVQVDVRVEPARGIALAYTLYGDLKHVSVPMPVAPRPADGLWRHTCFEAFVGRVGAEVYHEFNFAPSGEWAAYAFRRYREGSSPFAEDFDQKIGVQTDTDRLELNTVIPHAFLPAGPSEESLRLALSAVIEDQDGTLSYWALRHPPGEPDFHHPDAFALELNLEKDGK